MVFLFLITIYFFPQSTFFIKLFQLFSPRTLYLAVVRQDLHQPKLSSNINMMPSNCSRCTHNIQQNDHLLARIAVLQAQLQTISLGKGNLQWGKKVFSQPPIVQVLPL
jgi:hypothetical protein